MPENQITVELDQPFRANGVIVNSITLRSPKVGDKLAADSLQGSDAVKEVQFMASLANVSFSDLKEMDLKDYQKLQKAVEYFLD